MIILLLLCRTAIRPHLLLATEEKNNCTYAFLPEKQFGNENIVRNFKRNSKAYTKDMTDIHPFKMSNKIKSWLCQFFTIAFHCYSWFTAIIKWFIANESLLQLLRKKSSWLCFNFQIVFPEGMHRCNCFLLQLLGGGEGERLCDRVAGVWLRLQCLKLV